MKYTRNKLGQFCSNKTKRNVKQKISSSAKLPSVRNGSIYSWRGQLVRVRKDLNNGAYFLLFFADLNEGLANLVQ